eukprot:UN21192
MLYQLPRAYGRSLGDDYFEDAGALGLPKGDEEWIENHNDYRPDDDDWNSEDDYIPKKKSKKSKLKLRLKKAPKKRRQKAKKRRRNFRDKESELTSEWIRDSIANTSSIMYNDRPMISITKRPRFLHNRTKESMEELIET